MKAMNRAGNLKRMTTHSRRIAKHDEALLRQKECALLTPTQRVAKLDAGQHRATKERAKLAKAVK